MQERWRGRLEWTTVLLLSASIIFLVLGQIATAVVAGQSFGPGSLVASVGLIAAALAIAVSHPIHVLRRIGRKKTGGDRYEQMRRWTRFKVSSVLLSLMAFVALTAVLAAAAIRGGLVLAQFDAVAVRRVVLLLSGTLALNHVVVHYQSLRTPIDRESDTVRRILVFASTAAAVLFGLLALRLAVQPFSGGVALTIRSDDAPLLILAGQVCAAVAMIGSRHAPTPYSLLSEERRFYSGHSYLSRSKAVLMPSLFAFGLLLLLLLLFLVFGVGVAGEGESILQDRTILGFLLLVAFTTLASLGAASVLARSKDKAPLFQRQRDPGRTLKTNIFLGSVAAAVLLFLAAAHLFGGGTLFALQREHWIHPFAFALLALLGPIGFWSAIEQKRIRNIEERFPDFLRDLASSHRGGLTLPASIHIAARGDYGMLSSEIDKMAAQLSWNVPFQEALRRLGERVRTPLVQRAVNLILEAERSGGGTVDVILAASRDAQEIKTLEEERRISMGLYTAVIYITFFVFLAVSVVLFVSFVPQILAASQQGLPGLGGHGLELQDFRDFYFLAATVQAVGNGIVAGVMGSGQVLLGLRHSFAMVVITLVAFTFFLV